MSGGEGRMVQVGNADLHFASIDALEARALEEQRRIIALNDGALARNPRDRDAWRAVEQHAAILRDLTIALDLWIKAEDTALDREIEAVRQQIAALGSQNL